MVVRGDRHVVVFLLGLQQRKEIGRHRSACIPQTRCLRRRNSSSSSNCLRLRMQVMGGLESSEAIRTDTEILGRHSAMSTTPITNLLA